jgi:hypothetical protein
MRRKDWSGDEGASGREQSPRRGRHTAPLSPPGGGSYRGAPRGLRLGTRGTRLLTSPAVRLRYPVNETSASRPTVPHGIAVSEVAGVAPPFAVVMLIFPVTARSETVSVTSVGDDATTTATTVPTFTAGPWLPRC